LCNHEPTFGAIGYVVSGFLLDKSNDAVVKPSTSVHDWYVKEHTDDSHYFVRYLASAIEIGHMLIYFNIEIMYLIVYKI
jgi:hypothetical protein